MAGVASYCQILLMDKKAVELISAGEIRPSASWRMPPHSHSFHELICILSGSMVLKARDEEIVAGHGDALFYRAGMVHEEISQRDDPVSTVFIAFRTGELLPSIPLRMQDGDGRLRQLLSWLAGDFRSGRSAMECRSLLTAAVDELRRLCASPEHPWTEEVRDYMRKHYRERLALADLAGWMRMSRFAFVRKFRAMAGCTPMEQLRRIRLNEARNMILTSGLPLKRIAPACGLGDEYQLSKLFRRYFGLPPSRMRAWRKKR